MFKFFDKITLTKSLFFFVIGFYFITITFGLISRMNWAELVVGGNYYNQILLVKQFTSDIEPSKLDIDQYYLTSFLILNENDPYQSNVLIDRVEIFNREFEERSQKLLRILPDSLLKDQFYKSIYFTREFFQLWSTQFIPTIKKGDKKEAATLLNGIMKELYNGQNQVNQSLIAILSKQDEELQNEVAMKYTLGRILGLGGFAMIIICSAFLAYLAGRSFTHRLNTALKQIGSVSTEINFHMDQQAQSIAHQSELVNQTTASMNELNQSFHHTTQLAQESSKFAENALKVSEEGNNLIKQMLDGMMGHKEKVLAILDHILHLSEVINRIHSIASSINNLTNQTNILALNAAVQAAHVKQNGEGFSVIAGEIRKLADESKKFVSHIDQLTENIKHATDSTIRISEEGSQTVQESIKLAQSSSKAFDTIISITTHSVEGAHEVCLNIEQQNHAVHQVLEAMKELREAASQSLNDMGKVKSEVEKLDGLSQDLKTIM